MSVTNTTSPEGIKPYTISAEGISATFIAHGARLTHLFVKDKQGAERDVVVGYDDPAEYYKDTQSCRTYYGCIVGPYANRIRAGKFSIDGKEYQVDRNEHDDANTLHGGKDGYDARNWDITSVTGSSITFSLYDPAGTCGFPGAVQNSVTYALLSSPPRFVATSTSISLTHRTPIMPTTHIYWNIGAFTSPTVLDDTLHLPNARRFIVGDDILQPTGEIITLPPDDHLNFTTPKKIGKGVGAKFCGKGAEGIDNAFILDSEAPTLPVSQWGEGPVQLVWTSSDTGIQMSMRTNQPSVQVYAAAAQDGTIPLKKAHSQGKSTGYLEKNGCVVIEPQGWIDGINQTQWGQAGEQIRGPGQAPYVNWAEYSFDTL